jgi:hypothetical protein
LFRTDRNRRGTDIEPTCKRHRTGVRCRLAVSKLTSRDAAGRSDIRFSKSASMGGGWSFLITGAGAPLGPSLRSTEAKIAVFWAEMWERNFIFVWEARVGDGDPQIPGAVHLWCAQWVEVSRGELSVRVLRGENMGDLPLGSPAEWGWGSHSPTDLLPITRTLPPGESRPLLGFYVRRGSYNFGSSTKVIVPMPAVVVVLALPAGAWCMVLVRRRRARRLVAGRCLGCGYDLRASPQRCPECGRVVGKS